MNDPLAASEYASFLKKQLEVLCSNTNDLYKLENEIENEKKIEYMTEIIANLIMINKGTLSIIESVSRRYN